MYLLDTNVLSELRVRSSVRPDPNVAAWILSVPSSTFYISAITVLELTIGVLRAERNDAIKGSMLRQWLQDQVLVEFAGRILSVDLAVAEQCARLQVPDPVESGDALIAATALVHDLTLVTRNVTHFARTGVRILNPWNELQR